MYCEYLREPYKCVTYSIEKNLNNIFEMIKKLLFQGEPVHRTHVRWRVRLLTIHHLLHVSCQIWMTRCGRVAVLPKFRTFCRYALAFWLGSGFVENGQMQPTDVYRLAHFFIDLKKKYLKICNF